LSWAMNRHYVQFQPASAKQSMPRPQRQIIIARIVGYSCLLAAGGLCIVSQGLSVGLVFWMGLITLAALLQSLLLTYRPQWVKTFGCVLAVIGISSSLVSW